MSRILYLDCFSGISGDMTLGAFLDAGLPLDDLKRALGSLALDGVDISASRVLRTGVSATYFQVHESTLERPPTTLKPHAHRHLGGIFKIVDKSALSAGARERAKAMFSRLAETEAAIHQMPVEKVHLHEVGAIDSIIDIVGAAFAFEWAGADQVVCSPLNVGSGTVHAAHGIFPVPAPATLALLGDAPIYSGVVQKELVTPTGALIATAFSTSFGVIPPMSIERIGYGAGSRDNPDTPNVLRLLIGRAADRPSAERVTVIECEIDDMNPQIFGVAMDRLYAAGALEVFYVAAQMKKNRPGTLLTVVTAPEKRAQLADIIFRETTTIGVRYQDVERECLQREIISIETALGAVRFKVASRAGSVLNVAPEFEDCAKLAAQHGLPVKEVQALATQAYGARQAEESRA